MPYSSTITKVLVVKHTKFKTVDRDTLNLFPLSINDALKENHPARFVVKILDQIDLSEIEAAFSEKGRKAYPARVILGIIFYGYMTRIFASRKLELATHESIPFIYIAGGLHPDHDTIADFRKRFLKEMDSVFYQILELADELGVLILKNAANDGSKVLANASKYKALSWGHLLKREVQLRNELDLLHEMAQKAEDIPLGMNIPEEKERREALLESIGVAKAEIERRAHVRYEAEKAEYDEKMKQRENYEKQTGKKKAGRKPITPIPGPKKKDQVNLTDDESRIMPKSGGGFVQAYNSHITVDVDSRLIIAKHVTQHTNDKLEMEPTIKELQKTEKYLEAEIEKLLSDAGFHSENNVNLCKAANIQPLIPNGRDKHNKSLLSRFEHADPANIPKDADDVTLMKLLLKTKEGKELFALRKSTVETVFGGIKHAMGFTRYSFRGLKAVNGEWKIVCIAWNIKKMFALLSNQTTTKVTEKSQGKVPQKQQTEGASLGTSINRAPTMLNYLTQDILSCFSSELKQKSEGYYYFEKRSILNLTYTRALLSTNPTAS